MNDVVFLILDLVCCCNKMWIWKYD